MSYFFSNLFRQALFVNPTLMNTAQIQIKLFSVAPSLGSPSASQWLKASTVDELCTYIGWEEVAGIGGYPEELPQVTVSVRRELGLDGHTYNNYVVFMNGYPFYDFEDEEGLHSPVRVQGFAIEYVGTLTGTDPAVTVTNPMIFVTNTPTGSATNLDPGDKLASNMDLTLGITGANRWLFSWDDPQPTADWTSLQPIESAGLALLRAPSAFEAASSLHVWLYPQRANMISNPSFEYDTSQWAPTPTRVREAPFLPTVTGEVATQADLILVDEPAVGDRYAVAATDHIWQYIGDDPNDDISKWNDLGLPKGGGWCGVWEGSATGVLAVESNVWETRLGYDDYEQWTFQFMAKGAGKVKVALISWDYDYRYTAQDWGTETWTLNPGGWIHITCVRYGAQAHTAMMRVEVVPDKGAATELRIDRALAERGALKEYPYFDGDERYGALDDYSWYGGSSRRGRSYSMWYGGRRAVIGRLFATPTDIDADASGDVITNTDVLAAGMVYEWVPAGVTVIPHMDVFYPTDLRGPLPPRRTTILPPASDDDPLGVDVPWTPEELPPPMITTDWGGWTATAVGTVAAPPLIQLIGVGALASGTGSFTNVAPVERQVGNMLVLHRHMAWTTGSSSIPTGWLRITTATGATNGELVETFWRIADGTSADNAVSNGGGSLTKGRITAWSNVDPANSFVAPAAAVYNSVTDPFVASSINNAMRQNVVLRFYAGDGQPTHTLDPVSLYIDSDATSFLVGAYDRPGTGASGTKQDDLSVAKVGATMSTTLRPNIAAAPTVRYGPGQTSASSGTLIPAYPTDCAAGDTAFLAVSAAKDNPINVDPVITGWTMVIKRTYLYAGVINKSTYLYRKDAALTGSEGSTTITFSNTAPYMSGFIFTVRGAVSFSTPTAGGNATDGTGCSFTGPSRIETTDAVMVIIHGGEITMGAVNVNDDPTTAHLVTATNFSSSGRFTQTALKTFPYDATGPATITIGASGNDVRGIAMICSSSGLPPAVRIARITDRIAVVGPSDARVARIDDRIVVVGPSDARIAQITSRAVVSVAATTMSIMALTPVGYWPLNEVAGTVVTDISGNARHGTYSGSYSLANVAGPKGSHTRFGVSASSRVEIPDNAAFSGAAGIGITLFMLVKPDDLTTQAWLVDKVTTSSGYEYIVQINGTSTQTGKLQGTKYIYYNGGDNANSVANGVMTTAWQAIAIVFDGDKTVHTKLYRNTTPALVPSSASGTLNTDMVDGTAPLWLGQSSQFPTVYLKGGLAHVALFRSALSEAQISTLMAAAQADGWLS